jgi:fumarate reductase flavoprotein subunit
MNAATTEPRDVIVIGGGIAGLVAAVRAAELGLSVALLEQGTGLRYPCNTRFSGGILHAAYHDVTRPADELRAIIGKATRQAASAAVTDAVATDARRLLAWLRGHDVRFMRVGPLEAHRWCMAPPRPIVPGLIEWEGRGPDAMLRGLAAALRARGGEVVLGARARALVTRDGQCRGVIADAADGTQRFAAPAVVVADGGFQANADLFRRWIGPAPERVLQRGAATGRGDGLLMAADAGAAIAGTNCFYGHLMSRAALTDRRVWPYPELDGVAASAIVVGPDGTRIVNEGLGGIAIANALARLPDPASATIVCDRAIWDGPGRSARIPANPFLERYGGPLARADSLAGLAQRIGVPGDALVATIERYNAALASGRTDALAPPRNADKVRPWPIATPPFIAIPLCVGITHTMGGIVVDGDGCALRPDGSRLAGLYAAGSATAGLEGDAGGGHVGYVGGLVKAVLGLRAAEHVAAVRAHSGKPSVEG